MTENENKTAITKDLVNDKAICEMFIESGLFPDTKGVAQAVVKVWAGRSIGLSDYEAMSGLNIISGQITLSGNIQASFIKANPKYDYKVLESTAEICRIEFFQEGESIGIAEYTFEEASKITFWDRKLAKEKSLTTKDNWKNYPSDMLFNRCISRGRRRYAPDVFGGSRVYDPEELDNTEPINVTPKEELEKIDLKEIEKGIVARAKEELPVDDKQEPIIDTDGPIIPQESIEGAKTPWDALDKITEYATLNKIGPETLEVLRKYVPNWMEIDTNDIDEQIAIDLVKELTGFEYELEGQ